MLIRRKPQWYFYDAFVRFIIFVVILSHERNGSENGGQLDVNIFVLLLHLYYSIVTMSYMK